jgi:hypothetical protein
MGSSFARPFGLLFTLGTMAVSALIPPTPAVADEMMMGRFSTELTGQGMYANMDVGGHATGSLAEGIVLVQAVGLTPMMDEHTYVAWLVNPMTGERINAGALKPVGAAGAYTTVFTAGMPLTTSNFTMITVTSESMMNMSSMADGDVVIAGSL